MPVDAVRELGVLLDAGAGAAPEGFIVGVEVLPGAGGEREVILRVAGFGLDGAHAAVEEGALVVVH